MNQVPPPSSNGTVARTGVAGLDDVLGGGFPRRRVYLIGGRPGTGKTTLALQFLLEGRARGEAGLYVTLSETREELELVARSHGFTLDGISVVDLSIVEERLNPAAQTTLLHPGEVEMTRVVRLLEQEVEALGARRVAIDSLAELRLMAQTDLRYRRRILGLKTYFATRDCTVLLLDDGTKESDDPQVESIANGVVVLEHLRPEYGAERRRLSVTKLRGVAFRGGYHDFRIVTGGLVVYPRLVAADHPCDFEPSKIESGVASLDRLLGGGLDRGTSTLLIGPSGSGKSTIAIQYACAAACRGHGAAYFVFDENVGTVRVRARSLGMPLDAHVDDGTVLLRQVDPAELAPGEFMHLVRERVERSDLRLVVIDSVNGYLHAMPDERFLLVQLHEMLTYLAQRGVSTILIVAQHGFLGPMQSPVDVTYLADGVIVLRFFEFQGAIRKAVSVMKKRGGSHEDTIREFAVRPHEGIVVGEPLREFRGVLTGVPTYVGEPASILTSTQTERR